MNFVARNSPGVGNAPGIVDTLVSNLEKSRISCAGFWVFRRFNEGFADDEMRRQFALVVPHRALSPPPPPPPPEAAALADSLDTLPAGMFLVDSFGRIVHTNLCGHAMVSEGNVLKAGGGKLGALDPAGQPGSTGRVHRRRPRRGLSP